MGNCPNAPVTPSNSPYNISGGTTNCDKIEIKGGRLQLLEQSNLTITILQIDPSTTQRGPHPLTVKKG